ncbi:uncharacterized protein LOC128740235 [Sabethes cyaneus]|uniref:uncharacterized protein LOC128740235 n=1 Tax=Sabethes cyaneus TaxID=53552 RepID=UPI00237DDE5C|nr:uncharacterized protein LOC128740235 [Sabethes cyaneus]
MAVSRMKCLEKTLSRDPRLEERVREQITSYLHKGYAHVATNEEIVQTSPRKVWYLPLGVVTNPKKPSKIRLIWDAAAQVNGVSFNSKMLKGPDLVTPLPAVLYRFRQRAVAVCADIKEMFHQIRIRNEDRQSQRFLWRSNCNERPTIFVMDVATFGSACSPCSAQYIKNLNAKEFADKYPDASEAIENGHYVDDFLDSRDTNEEVFRVAEDVRKVHSLGGFDLRNFVSNSVEVLDKLGEVDPSLVKVLNLTESGSSESVLGIRWLPQTDELTFSADITNIRQFVCDKVRPTKRQVLRIVMSLYDPLGLLAAYLIHGRIIIQDTWRTKCEWDEEVNDTIYADWKRWINLLPKITEVTVPRAYFGSCIPELCQPLQLHMFVDASTEAYASVVYIRFMVAGKPRCALVGAKAKVAPIKPLSVPRLELQAATVGTRFLQYIIDHHKLPFNQKYLWTDSSTVMHWIHSTQRKYPQYVGCRVGEILTHTNPGEWRWVPTKQNVADEATKWGQSPSFDPSSRWFRGPEFLWEPEESWPQQNWTISKPESETYVVNVHSIIAEPLIEVTRFSKWERMLRASAYVFLFISISQRRSGRSPKLLERTFQQQAETALWKIIQRESYPGMVAELLKNTTIKPSGAVPIYYPQFKTTVIIDEEGVVRLDGRIGAAPNLPIEAKYPVILAANHPITFLFVDFYHRRFNHRNRETVCNEVRQLAYIPGLRNLIRKVAGRCQWCKVYATKPTHPKMAPLPKTRLIAFERPFTIVGLDYFGPLLVKVGRSQVKRWVALFTCFSTRAVHMEVAHSLSTASCKMCIRRSIARRGAPSEICSDNGTNFRGAANELQDQLQLINEQCAESFTNTTTKWYFNPPAAPHMGGVWERLVRSVKVALESFVNAPRVPDEETFETIILEAESMINSRPLTYIPLESEVQEALTPIHFLLGSSNGIRQPPQEPTKALQCLRSNWNLAKYILDGFWQRWIREYLPTIARRTKWFLGGKPLKVGDLVFIVDEGKRNSWVRGQVVELLLGKDGTARQALVKTQNGIIRRPAIKLAVIDICQENFGKTEIGEVHNSVLRAGECRDNEEDPSTLQNHDSSRMQ